MRALLITAAAVGAAIMLAGCPHKRSQPVPGPQSAPTRTATVAVGTLDEAFSPRPCRQRRLLFHY
jgi:hypothetical protein